MESLVTNVTAVGSPARAERNILGISNSRRFLPIQATFVDNHKLMFGPAAEYGIATEPWLTVSVYRVVHSGYVSQNWFKQPQIVYVALQIHPECS